MARVRSVQLSRSGADITELLKVRETWINTVTSCDITVMHFETVSADFGFSVLTPCVSVCVLGEGGGGCVRAHAYVCVCVCVTLHSIMVIQCGKFGLSTM